MDHVTELGLLVELDRTGNLRRAAEALAISQSTLSAALGRIEQRYGAPLFDRDQRGTRPTACGRIVIDAAAQALEALDQARRHVDLLTSPDTATVAVGVDPSLVEAFVVPALASLLTEPSSIRITVRSGSADELLRLLRQGQVEYFLGLRPDGPLEGVTLRPVGSVSVVPFCRPGHPLTALPPLGVRVVSEYPVVVTTVPRWYQQQVRENLPRDEDARHVDGAARTIELEDYGAVRALVQATDAIGLAPYGAIQTAVEAGRLAVLLVPDDQQSLVRSRTIVVATSSDRPLPPAAQRTLDVLIRTVAERADDPTRE